MCSTTADDEFVKLLSGFQYCTLYENRPINIENRPYPLYEGRTKNKFFLFIFYRLTSYSKLCIHL